MWLVGVGLVVAVAGLEMNREVSYLESKVIPDNQQISAFLQTGETRLFFYLLQRDASSLSVTLTPCTSTILWTVHFKNANDTGKVEVAWSGGLWEVRGKEAQTFSVRTALQGLYLVQATSLDAPSYLQLHATTRYPAGHPALALVRAASLFVTNRRTRGEISLRWQPSRVDPDQMVYWLVVSEGSGYGTMCRAQGERLGVRPPRPRSPRPLTPSFIPPLNPDVIMEYAGRRTSWVIGGLEPGKQYTVDLFLVDTRSNLSLHYGRATARYSRNKPVPLRELRPATANLRRMDGRATFRYKVKNGAKGALEWYVMPCGEGWVDAEVRARGVAVVPRQPVRGYAILRLDTPQSGARYTLRLNATDPEQLAKITSVEVMGSMQGLPLPKMPLERRVHEYVSLRSCNSVTLGWLQETSRSGARYCVRAREANSPHYSPIPDQCNLDAAINNLDFQILQCQDIPSNNNRSVITEKVTNLKPGRTYELQVTVKTSKTKMLSYQLLRVHTKSLC